MNNAIDFYLHIFYFCSSERLHPVSRSNRKLRLPGRDQPGLYGHPSAVGSSLVSIGHQHRSTPLYHNLRHTAASLMLNNNIAPITVARRLGHSRASITLDIYRHLIPGLQEEVANRIDDLVLPTPKEFECITVKQ